VAYSMSAGIKTDGTLWAWGDNDQGQLGLGDITDRSSPVQIGALTTWSKLGRMETGCLSIKTDGTFWTWGANGQGQLGLGSTVYKSSPNQVGSLTTWSKISGGGSHFIALR
jgi:alpha-tubulin suppressor-like RCC1 family protein